MLKGYKGFNGYKGFPFSVLRFPFSVFRSPFSVLRSPLYFPQNIRTMSIVSKRGASISVQ